MDKVLESNIQFLPGVGPKKAELLRSEIGVERFTDMLYYFPYRYIDRSKFYTISQITEDLPYIQIKGRFGKFILSGTRGRQRLSAIFSDETGSIEILWFKGLKWIAEAYSAPVEYVLFGKPVRYGSRLNIVHPEIEVLGHWQQRLTKDLTPMYNTSEKMKNSGVNSRALQRIIETLWKQSYRSVYETLPSYIVQKYQLMPLAEAIGEMHFPTSVETLNKAQYRFKFEELFYIQLKILRMKQMRNERSQGYVFSKMNDKLVKECFFKNIPFRLTRAQTQVLQEIRKFLESGRQMNVLLQGDVGSGKTLVALLSMLIAVDNGFQTCIMVPTEILAQQHYASFKKYLDGLDVNFALLTGSTKKAERKLIYEQVSNGELKILVGTHALIEDTVVFHNLGLVVIDEQHRFGVAQRAALWEKNEKPPHILIMTATPIPRTLAMTLYGDLDVCVIDEMPPGRKPIITRHATDADRLKVFGWMRKLIDAGKQIYVVYPLIEESEKLDYKTLEDGIEGITRAFPPPHYGVAVVHGRMKPADKEFSMQWFASGEANILIATTVIEVGVDVPNACMIVVESAERFGLSQLHQLRGRVGRGSDQSYCILMTGNKISENAIRRIEAMVETNDGFALAEADMRLRGPGDIEGTRQSGFELNLRVANLAKDGQILLYVRQIAEAILSDDAGLQKDENLILIQQLKRLNPMSTEWRKIS